MAMVSNRISAKIANLSFLSSILVCAIHGNFYPKVSAAGWWCEKLLQQGLSCAAVPFFFIVSGYMLARHFKEDDWWHKEIVKRIRTILVPLSIWLFIGFVAFMPLGIVADVVAGRPFGTNLAITPAKLAGFFGLDLSRMPGVGPLWYLRTLFLIVLLARPLKWLVCRFGAWWLATAYFLMVVGLSWREACGGNLGDNYLRGFYTYGLSVSGVFYMSAGMYLSTHSALKRKISGRGIAFCSSFVAIALLMVRGWWYRFEIPPLALSAFFVPCILVALYHYVPDKCLPNVLSRISFPLFVMHPIIGRYLGILFDMQKLVPNGCAKGVMVLLLTVLLSIGVAISMRRFCPKFAYVAMGGRI